MAAALPYSRNLSQRLWAKSAWPFTRPDPSHSYLRVSCICTTSNHRQNLKDGNSSLVGRFKHGRTYATAAPKTSPKLKATPRRPTAVKKTATKKSATKKAVRKPKKKTVKKPKAKKPKVKKPRVKRAPTKTALAQKARTVRTELRTTALLETPKKLPATAFTVLLVAESKGTKESVTKAAASASAKYKSLSPEERERLNHEANQNAEKNAVAYKRWVQSYTPLQIKQANNARKLLAARAKAAGLKTQYPKIQDDRVVKQPRNAYAYFFTERHASGDFNGISLVESGKLVGQEWNGLSENAKKPYHDQAEADRNRYYEEYKSVYGVDAPALTRKGKDS